MTVLRALLLVVLLVPAASAQLEDTLEVRVGALPAFIPPEIESPTFTIDIVASCHALLTRAAPASPQAPLYASLAFDAPDSVVVTGPQTVEVDPTPCPMDPAGSVTTTQAMQVTAWRTAPGLAAITVSVRATLSTSSPLAGNLESNATTFTVTPDYYSLNQVKLAEKLKLCQGGHAVYEVEVTNFGNAATRYEFDLAAAPTGAEWQATLPQPLTLDRPQTQDGVSAKATIEVACPTSGNTEGSFQVVIRPSAAADPGKTGNPLTANLLARVHSSDGPIPAPAGPWLMASLLLAALVARRRA